MKESTKLGWLGFWMMMPFTLSVAWWIRIERYYAGTAGLERPMTSLESFIAFLYWFLIIGLLIFSIVSIKECIKLKRKGE